MMKSNNRITYRFDRQGRQVTDREVNMLPAKEKNRKHETLEKVVPLYPDHAANVIDELHPWDSAYQQDVGALEELIRSESDYPSEKLAGSSEESSEEAEWDRIASSDGAAYRSRSNGPSWFHVFLSVAGALATGALFGYIVLSLLTGGLIWNGGDNRDSSASDSNRESVSLDELIRLPMTESAGNEGGQSLHSDKPGNNGPDNSVPALSVNISGTRHSFTMLQYGVFSGTEGRDDAILQLADKGLPHSSSSSANGKSYPVYAGIAISQAQASTLAGQMTGLELYKKELVLQSPDRFIFGGEEKEARLFFEKTNELLSSWSTLMIAQLEQPSLSPLGGAASKAWQESYKEWLETASIMKNGLMEDKGLSYMTRLTDAFGSISQLMLAYDKDPSKAALWKAQTGLMEAVLAQKEWFETMSAL